MTDDRPWVLRLFVISIECNRSPWTASINATAEWGYHYPCSNNCWQALSEAKRQNDTSWGGILCDHLQWNAGKRKTRYHKCFDLD